MNNRRTPNNVPITSPPISEEFRIRQGPGPARTMRPAGPINQAGPTRAMGIANPPAPVSVIGGAGPIGPMGPTGPTGATGPAGTSGSGGGLASLVDGNASGSVRGVSIRDNYPMGENAIALGHFTEASGNGSFAQGFASQAAGLFSNAQGYDTRAVALAAHAQGNASIASGEASHAEGMHAQAQGTASHAEGLYTKAQGKAGHAEGAGTSAAGSCSHVEGNGSNDNGHTGVHVMGRYGAADTDYSWFLGNGSSGAPGLAAKILNDGNAYIDVAWNGGGADYAELFETASGQPIEPGYFVTFAGTGDKIRVAQAYDDYVLGVVSRAPGFVAGGGELRWKNKFKTDEWGGLVYEDVTVPDETDDQGHVILPAHVEHRPVMNPGFDPGRAYVTREKRPEWVKVGLLGRLLVRDDGTLTAGGYCRPGMNGIAAASHTGYRVLKRTGPNQVTILMK